MVTWSSEGSCPARLYQHAPRDRRQSLGTVLGRREDQAERRRQHIAELERRATESELRLKRLYDAIEGGVADLDDPALKERIVGLKVIRDQARTDADRAQALLDSPGHSAISPAMIEQFARVARERIRGWEGGYRRDHLRALAQRVEVADDAIRIMGSKTELLRTLIAGQVRQSAATGVPRSGLKWRRESALQCLPLSNPPPPVSAKLWPSWKTRAACAAQTLTISQHCKPSCARLPLNSERKTNMTATNPSLAVLLKYIGDVQSKACRLAGIASAIAYLENEGACGEGQCTLIFIAEELAAEINSALDSVNLPEVAL